MWLGSAQHDENTAFLIVCVIAVFTDFCGSMTSAQRKYATIYSVGEEFLIRNVGVAH
jgi:hypothetical protein